MVSLLGIEISVFFTPSLPSQGQKTHSVEECVPQVYVCVCVCVHSMEAQQREGRTSTRHTIVAWLQKKWQTERERESTLSVITLYRRGSRNPFDLTFEL